MHLTERQRQIASRIDRDVQRIGQQAKSQEAAEEALIELMPQHMDGFKHLLDTLDSGSINVLGEEVPGFFIFAQMMERIAAGCRDGLFDELMAK